MSGVPPSTMLVVGATGATGNQLVRILLERGFRVRVVVRSPERLFEASRANERLEVTTASLLDMPEDELRAVVAGCTAVHACLGHNMTLKGIYGAPRTLVRDAVSRLTSAVEASNPAGPVKFVLMNTAGVVNKYGKDDADKDDQRSFAERLVIGAVGGILPPHRDNELAAKHLATEIGTDKPHIEWVVVRPDNLTDEAAPSAYSAFAVPQRSCIFNPGQTSRVNVAAFMADLVGLDAQSTALWERWRFRMPLLYNAASVPAPAAGNE